MSLRHAMTGALVLAGAGAIAVLIASGPRPAAEPDFSATWHDGRAELDGYRLTLTRYGEPRTGTAALIYVTEPFDRAAHVKVDDPARDPARVVDVLKLNFVRRFQTGLYDYHTMSSLFVASADFAPLKLAFSSDEWCGAVYEELHWHGARLADRLASYFEGESGDRELPLPAGGITEDELFVRLRGLRGPFLEPGASREVPFLASAFLRRLTHRPLEWTSATIGRARRGESVRVPAGAFACDVYSVRVADGREGRFWVETAHPHRIVRWRWSPAPNGKAEGLDAGELTGSDRQAYWNLHQQGGESHLRTLGLPPLP